MTAELIQLAKPKTSKSKKPTPQVAIGARMRRKLTQQKYGACFVGFVALVLTGLSLSHLAHGIVIVTKADAWESWAMAVGVDLSFVILELASLFTATEQDREKIKDYVNWTIRGTLAFSAAFNAFAFYAQAEAVLMQVVAVALGFAIPGLIYALTRVGAILYIGYTARTN